MRNVVLESWKYSDCIDERVGTVKREGGEEEEVNTSQEEGELIQRDVSSEMTVRLKSDREILPF